MTEQEAPSRSEQAIVECWREHVLLEAGYPVPDAVDLARRPDVDLHTAVALLDGGCDLATAMEILL